MLGLRTEVVLAVSMSVMLVEAANRPQRIDSPNILMNTFAQFVSLKVKRLPGALKTLQRHCNVHRRSGTKLRRKVEKSFFHAEGDLSPEEYV